MVEAGVKGGEGRVVVEVRGAQSVGLLLAAGWLAGREGALERGLGTGDCWEWTDKTGSGSGSGSGQAHSSLGIRKQRAASHYVREYD